jgi:predicted RNA-binding protein with PUA-like domain
MQSSPKTSFCFAGRPGDNGGMKYWLMKSEPEAFSIDDLQRVGREPWSGVRNYLARNFMRQMAVGDGVLFYHSNTKVPGVVGVAEVASDAYPDPTQFQKKSDYYDPKATHEEPRWQLVDVSFKRKLSRIISLEELRARGDQLDGMELLRRGSRLSVMPVSAAHWKTILSLE